MWSFNLRIKDKQKHVNGYSGHTAPHFDHISQILAYEIKNKNKIVKLYLKSEK